MNEVEGEDEYSYNGDCVTTTFEPTEPILPLVEVKSLEEDEELVVQM